MHLYTKDFLHNLLNNGLVKKVMYYRRYSGYTVHLNIP